MQISIQNSQVFHSTPIKIAEKKFVRKMNETQIDSLISPVLYKLHSSSFTRINSGSEMQTDSQSSHVAIRWLHSIFRMITGLVGLFLPASYERERKVEYYAGREEERRREDERIRNSAISAPVICEVEDGYHALGEEERRREDERVKNGAMSYHIKNLRQKCCLLYKNAKTKMLIHCADKDKRKDSRNFGSILRRNFEEFPEEKLETGVGNLKKLCSEIVESILENEWWIFVRLCFNLNEAEIQEYRRQYCVLTKQQQDAILLSSTTSALQFECDPKFHLGPIKWSQCQEAETLSTLDEYDDGVQKFPYDIWRQRYGRLSKKERHRMLVFSTNKERYQGNKFFEDRLRTSFTAFTGKYLRSSSEDFDALCCEIVNRIPEDNWMKFFRLHLNLNENEIQGCRRQGCVFTTQQQFDILSSSRQLQNQRERCSNAQNELGKESKMRQEYGKLEVNKRMGMLMLSKDKEKADDILEFASFLKYQFKEFTGKKLKAGIRNFNTLCWEIVDRIPEEKWMKFVRLHLNLTENEIKEYRGQHCALTVRQQEAI